jgi:hypothetical protein
MCRLAWFYGPFPLQLTGPLGLKVNPEGWPDRAQTGRRRRSFGVQPNEYAQLDRYSAPAGVKAWTGGLEALPRYITGWILSSVEHTQE